MVGLGVYVSWLQILDRDCGEKSNCSFRLWRLAVEVVDVFVYSPVSHRFRCVNPTGEFPKVEFGFNGGSPADLLRVPNIGGLGAVVCGGDSGDSCRSFVPEGGNDIEIEVASLSSVKSETDSDPSLFK